MFLPNEKPRRKLDTAFRIGGRTIASRPSNFPIKTVDKIFNDLAKRYEKRAGGYTQILKLTERRGDNSLMVILRLVDETKPEEKK